MEKENEYVKVHMTGEWPWVFVVRKGDEELIGRVDNHLLCTHMHGFEFNDIVRFKKISGVWEAQEKVNNLKVLT